MAQNVLKVDIKKDDLVFYVNENKKVEVRKSEVDPYTFIVVGDGQNEKFINISGLGIPSSGDVFVFLLGLLSDPKLFKSVLDEDYKDMNSIVFNAELEEAQLWNGFELFILDRVLSHMGFRRSPTFDDSNVLEYVHPNGGTLEIHYSKINKNNTTMYLIYKLEGVIKLK